MSDDYFLEVAEVPGESTDKGHVGQIEILAYSHGVSQLSSGSRSSAGSATSERVTHQDMTITKFLDKATPVFNDKCCKGAHIPNIKLYLRRAKDDGSVDYMVYELKDSIVSSVSVSGGGDVPTETVTFNYGKIKWTYTETGDKDDTKGNVEANWSVIDNIYE